jgi:hypothetical protein
VFCLNIMIRRSDIDMKMLVEHSAVPPPPLAVGHQAEGPVKSHPAVG